jgi:hypothetical protein
MEEEEMRSFVKIETIEYKKLLADASSWRKHRERMVAGAEKTNSSMTPEERSKRAKKAVEAREAKKRSMLDVENNA